MQMVKETVRKYYKYEVQPFTRPNLTKDGEVGYDECACYASDTVDDTSLAYKAFDEDTGYSYALSWRSINTTDPHSIVFYSPNAINATALIIRNSTFGNAGRYQPHTGNIYGSNDNKSWTLITTYENLVNGAGAYWDLDLGGTTEYYKYWKLESITSYTGNRNYVFIADINFKDATQKVPVESTSSNYDFYKDIQVYKAVQSGSTYKAVGTVGSGSGSQL